MEKGLWTRMATMREYSQNASILKYLGASGARSLIRGLLCLYLLYLVRLGIAEGLVKAVSNEVLPKS